MGKVEKGKWIKCMEGEGTDGKREGKGRGGEGETEV